MTWPRPDGWGGPRPWQGPSSRRPTPRITLTAPDERPRRPHEEWAWPAECRLGARERAVVDGTHRDGEVPCFGCPSREGCAAREDDSLRTAAEVMGVGLADLVLRGGLYRKCECGAFMREWRVNLSSWAREWVCDSPTSGRVFTEVDETDIAVLGICRRVHPEPARGTKMGAGDLHSGGGA